MLCTEGLERIEKLQDVGFVLPSDIIDYVFKLGNPAALKSFFSDGRDGVAQFWEREYERHLLRLELEPNEFPRTLPIMWHEDAVPHWHGETGAFWSWSTALAYGGAWSSRHCFVGIATSAITTASRDAILEVLSWDMRSLRVGLRPTNDHAGHPLLGKRGKLAGTALAMKGAFTYWKGDAEARFVAHESSVENLRGNVLMFSPCLLNMGVLSFHKFSQSVVICPVFIVFHTAVRT